jgi:hypothetical protein
MIGPDNSLLGGVVGAGTLFALNYVFVRLTFRSARARRLLEGTPRVLLEHGQLLLDALRREAITIEKLRSAALERWGRPGARSLSGATRGSAAARGVATVSNTDTIRIVGTAPGATAEAAHSEIEIMFYSPAVASSRASQSRAATITSPGRTDGVNLNANEATDDATRTP